MKYRCVKSSSANWSKKFNDLIYIDKDITEKNITSYKELFEHLIDGISFDTFISEIFEKTPCYFMRETNDTNNLVDILSCKSFLKIIKTDFNDHIIPNNNITAVRYIDDERDDLDWFDIVSSKKRKAQDEDIYVSSKDIDKAFSQLYTLQFYQPQRFLDHLHKINSSFEYHFGTLAGSSAYLTPSPSQGLPPHHDDVDVFILQTEGEKLWYIWNGDEELPDNYARIEREKLPSQCQEILLRKGDMLYLPRGTIHEAIAKDSFSTHVTISIYQHYNMKTLLLRALPLALNKAFEQDISIRKGLPIRFSDTFGSFASKNLETGQKLVMDYPQAILSRENFLQKCQSIVNSLTDFVTIDTIDQAADEVVMDFVENRLPPPLSLNNNLNNKSKGKLKISGASKVRLIDPNIMQCTIQEVDGVSLLCVFNALYNNRLSHMGHPLDVDEDEDEDEDEPNEPFLVSFPARLSPIICSLIQAYPNYSKVTDIANIVSLCQISAGEVNDTIQTLNQYHFIDS